MMRSTTFIVLFAALIWGGNQQGHTQDAVEIEDFRSGPVCLFSHKEREKKDEEGWVCIKTETIPITNMGRCTFDGERRPCTWYGYEFNYVNADEDTVLDCRVESDEPSTFGNPNEIESTRTEIYEYQILLDGTSGHFFNPQYSLFSLVDEPDYTVKNATVCRIAGQEVFRFSYNLLFAQRAFD